AQVSTHVPRGRRARPRQDGSSGARRLRRRALSLPRAQDQPRAADLSGVGPTGRGPRRALRLVAQPGPTMTDAAANSQRIERLLDEVRATCGPSTWQRVEELIRALVGLYGAGLERLLLLAAETGALAGPLRERLCKDELVSSLLLLHRLHPL